LRLRGFLQENLSEIDENVVGMGSADEITSHVGFFRRENGKRMGHHCVY
jgi:hypothetical protein